MVPSQGMGRSATNVISSATSGATSNVRREVPSTSEPDTSSRTVGSEKNQAPAANLLRPPNGEDSRPVDLIEREKAVNLVKTKFDDIFEVEKNLAVCADFEHIDFDQFSDEVNTVGCFCTDKALRFFKALNASPYVLNIIENGHHPVLTGKVERYEIDNHSSFRKHSEFAIPELLKLIKTGRVEIVDKKPDFLNPLHVVEQPTKKRLILDCSHLNDFIEIPSFKYEDHKSALCSFKKNGFMITYDLKDGYNQILIDKRFRKYLSFKFVYKGKTIYAQYVCGPFGLKDLPYVFTKIFRPLIKHWRACAIAVVQFLDDGWACFSSLREAEIGSEHIRKDLLRFGAVWSIKKCFWVPVQVLDWIGFTWNCVEGSLRIKESRVSKIITTCENLLEKRQVSARVLASFTGQIISMIPVIDDLARFHTRISQMAVADAFSWDSPVQLNEQIKSEISYWIKNIRSLNVRYIFDVQVPVNPIIIEGDASHSGCGSYIVGQNEVAARLFSPEECLRHSTWRELENVRFSMEALAPYVSGANVLFRTDNQSTQKILKRGSMKRDCHDLAKSTVDFCHEHDISLDVQWIPRGENKIADAISREPEILDTDDWGISPNFFQFLEKRYGSFTLDAFANSYNNKVSKFYSLFNVPGSAGVNAFSYDWSGEFVLLVPPVSIVGRVLHHMALCRSSGVLLIPCWPSAYFWPILINDFSCFILDIIKVKGSKILIQGYNRNSLLGSDRFFGFMLIIRIDCSKSARS